MRAAVVLLLMAGLCACKPKPAVESEGVWSARALYRPNDAAGAPALRVGLWSSGHGDCVYDEAKSTGVWPECAEWMVVRPQMLITHYSGYPLDQLVSDRFVLASGYPRILQLSLQPPSTPQHYDFDGLRALGLDDQGRIIRMRRWTSLCADAVAAASGAPPTSASPSSSGSMSDRSALPGSDAATALSNSMAPVADLCRIYTRGAVRAAVIAAEDPNDEVHVFHWVRDQEH